MSNEPHLTLALINRRPDSVAAVLASLSARDASHFLAEIPTRHAAKVLQVMNPRLAGPVIAAMDELPATALIRELEFSQASLILRQIPAEQRPRLLATLPRRQQRQFESSLAFGLDTVGAHMSTAINILADTNSVSNALELISNDRQGSCDLIFIVADDRRLIGVVRLLTLLRHARATTLSDIVDQTCTAVSSNVPLTVAAQLPAWDAFDILPVIDRRGTPVGAVSRVAAFGALAAQTPEPGGQSVLGSLLQLMGESALSLGTMLAKPATGRRGSSHHHER